MSTWGKASTLMLVALFLTLTFSVPSMTNAQITSSYSNNLHINPTTFTLTIYSPENRTYNSTMPLNFTIDWTEYPTFTFPIPPAPKLNAVYTYTLDDSPVFVSSNQSSSDVFGYSNFKVNPSFSYLVNVSNLATGYHKIVIIASLFGDEDLFFSASSSPVIFLVQNPTPSSATGALISPLTITIIVTVTVFVAVVISLILYRRHEKSLF